MSLPPPIPLDEAQARLLAGVVPLPPEDLPLAAASGRYLAQDLAARRTQPAADLSAMDGYAMLADDTAGPWEVIGESAAGHPYTGNLVPGQAIRISTGAHMPQGNCAVLLQENVTREGNRLELSGDDGPTSRHVRRKGFDFATGNLLLERGTRMDPARIALAISGGFSNARFGRLARVAVIDSGDELAADPTEVLAHQIPASNGAMLAAMVAPFAADVRRVGPVEDRLEALVAAFDKVADAHVIVTSGGASVGDHDLMRPALEAWGADIHFWRIAMKPGKPLMVARKGATTVLGLPGNPVSSHVTAFLFALPLLRALAGAARPLPRAMTLPLAGDLPEVGNRTEFARAILADDGVRPVSQQDSSAQVALAGADALIRREIAAPLAKHGDLLPVYLLRNGGIA
jgi:molybdopterin molybdotransferase